MPELTLSDLPEVFVAFETVKALKGRVVYCHENLGYELNASELLSKYNYVTLDTAAECDNVLDRKTFFAERYGGDGICTNGGGGRCGFDGVFHLKGLGPNQLVGTRPRDTYGNSHANGFLSLDVAIYESIWAEVINIALPYGAVRTVAVIDSEIDFEEPDQKLPRGLLVRLPAVRPAHFIRAIYFKERKRDVLSEDAKRVKLAIHRLVDFLPVKDDEQRANDLNERICQGMVELATRYAQQFAAARAKRIFHQSISSSNVTLSGAWMDLAGATVFSDKVWWEGFNIKQFLTEYESALGGIRDMCFYLCKYGVISALSTSAIVEQAVGTFISEYERSLSLYHAAQAGFPFAMLKNLSGDVCFLAYSGFIHRVLRVDQYSVTPITTSEGWQGHEHWVSKLYLQLLRRKIYQSEEDFGWVSKDQALLNGLTGAYDALFDLVLRNAETSGVTYSSFCKLMTINATRLNRCGLLLFGLQEKIMQTRLAAKTEKSAAEYDGVFQEAIDLACLAYEYSTGTRTLFWKNATTTIYYDAASDLFIAEVPGRDAIIKGAFFEVEAAVSLMKSAASFYGDGVKIFYESTV